MISIIVVAKLSNAGKRTSILIIFRVLSNTHCQVFKIFFKIIKYFFTLKVDEKQQN